MVCFPPLSLSLSPPPPGGYQNGILFINIQRVAALIKHEIQRVTTALSREYGIAVSTKWEFSQLIGSTQIRICTDMNIHEVSNPQQ